jgi:hypothetical protein
VIIDAFVFDLGGCYIVLEFNGWRPWVTMDRRKKTMSFENNVCTDRRKGHRVQDRNLPASLQGIIQDMDVDGEESLPIVGQQGDSVFREKELEHILSKHPSIFQSRRGLSPHRCHDHAINLQHNSNSISG